MIPPTVTRPPHPFSRLVAMTVIRGLPVHLLEARLVGAPFSSLTEKGKEGLLTYWLPATTYPVSRCRAAYKRSRSPD